MAIRKASDYETQQIMGYSLQVLNESSMGYVLPSLEKVQQMVLPFLADGGYYLVHAQNNHIRGWIGVGRTIDHYTDEIVGLIPELFVLKPYRHQGIAEELCIEALSRFENQGYDTVQLNVFAGNSIKNLYEKLGFQDVTTLMAIKFN